MNNLLAIWFVDALPMTDSARLMTFLPLCLLVAVGYGAVKVPSLTQLPRSALLYFFCMIVIMPAIGFALWGLLHLAAG